MSSTTGTDRPGSSSSLRGTASITSSPTEPSVRTALHLDPSLVNTNTNINDEDNGEAQSLSFMEQEAQPLSRLLEQESAGGDNYTSSTTLMNTTALSLQEQQQLPLLLQGAPTLQTSSTTICHSHLFPGFFLTFLGCIVVFRFIMCALLIRHRKQGNLQLAQAPVLAVLLLAGSVSIASCGLLLVHSCGEEFSTMRDVFCWLRDPLLLTPLTLAGCILLGRVWRIVLLLTPVFQVADDDEEMMLSAIIGMWNKRVIMRGLTWLADSYAACGHYLKHHVLPFLKTLFTRRKGMGTSSRHHHHNDQRCRGNQHDRARIRNIALRRKVPVSQLLWLIALLMLPQLLLQLANISIPQLQERLQLDSNSHSQEITLQFANYTTTVVMQEQQWVCRAGLGGWPTYLGVVLALLPYMLTAILAWNSAADLPKVFDEARATTRGIKNLLLVAAMIIPPRIMISSSASFMNPDVTVYLTTMLVFALAMPPCWFIVYPKIWRALQEDSRDRVAIRRLLVMKTKKSKSTRTRNDNDPTAITDSDTNNYNQYCNNSQNNNSAKLALTIGKMYEDMGNHSQSLTLFDDALAVWQVDPMRDKKEQIGGFTRDEIEAFSVSDLECVVQLLIAKGRVHGTFNSADKSGPRNAAQAWLDALEIYELAPARPFVSDRSMLFPTFSGLFVFLKGGKIQDDEKGTFEQNLAKKFVRETKLQGDAIHYTRALAMLCEVKARHGKYKIALESFEILKQIYDVEEHSAGISEAYGTDRSAQAFSQCALWHKEMGHEEKALEACEYVLNEMMFLMDPQNVLNMCEMLLPILRIYVPMGKAKRMRDLFQKYVIQNHEKYFVKHDKSSPCSPVFKPLMMLLDICHDPANFRDLEDAVEWLIQDESGVVPDFLDSVYTKLCWSPNSMTAELCLKVAELLIAKCGDAGDVEALILKGLDLCAKADKKIRSRKDGSVMLPIAYGMNEPVNQQLKVLALSQGIEWMSEEEGNQSIGRLSSQDSKLDLKNLPNAYKRRARSSDGGSSSNQSPLLARTSLVSFASGTSSRGSASSRGSKSNDNKNNPGSQPATSADLGHLRSSTMTSRVSEISLDGDLMDNSRVENKSPPRVESIEEFAEDLCCEQATPHSNLGQPTIRRTNSGQGSQGPTNVMTTKLESLDESVGDETENVNGDDNDDSPIMF